MAATDNVPIIKVLITMHPGMDTLDFVGPLEVLAKAQHNPNDECKSINYLHRILLTSLLPLPSKSPHIPNPSPRNFTSICPRHQNQS
jgi:hypothetical protein